MTIEVLFPGDEGHYLTRPEPPLTEAEKAFRHHCRADNPRARSVTPAFSRFCAEARARWEAAHPKIEKPKAANPKKKAPKAPPKYNQKWDPGIARQDEPATLIVKEDES